MLRKRRCRIDELSGSGPCGLCAAEEGGDEDEGELKEEGGEEGVWELETEGELTLSEPELCWQR